MDNKINQQINDFIFKLTNARQNIIKLSEQYNAHSNDSDVTDDQEEKLKEIISVIDDIVCDLDAIIKEENEFHNELDDARECINSGGSDLWDLLDDLDDDEHRNSEFASICSQFQEGIRILTYIRSEKPSFTGPSKLKHTKHSS